MERRIWPSYVSRPLVAVLLALGTFVIAACGGDDDNASSTSGGSGAESTGGTVTVGFTPALTGFLGPFDTEVVKGARLRAEQLNAEGGAGGKWKIKLLVQDGASDPAKQRVAAQDVIDQGAEFMIGSCNGSITTPAALFAKSKGIATVTTCSGDAAFPSKVPEYGFVANSGAPMMGSAMGEFAADKGWKRAYLVGSDTNEYVAQITKGFKTGYPAAGGKITGEDSAEIFKQSYAAQVNKIKAAGDSFDVVVTPLFVPDAVTFIKQLRGAGIDKPVVLDDGGDAPLLFSAGDPGEVYVATFGFAQPGNALEKFNAAFAEKYGKPPTGVQPGLGGDLIDLIGAAAVDAGSNDPQKLRDAFAALKNIQATTAKVSYAGAPYGPGLQQHPLAILKTVGTKFEYQTTVDPDPANVPKP
jgi:branched-chain amino acid transport system substrate-binding protein